MYGFFSIAQLLKLTGTREPDIKTREERVAEFEQQATAVNQLIANRADAIATAPNPFDDNARRARATNLAGEEERFDTAAANYDRRARYYSGSIESAYRRARQIRLSYAQRLLDRHKEANRLRPGWRESSDDYPNKFDYRQSDLLDAFAEKFKLSKADDEDYRDYLKRISDTFDSAFVKENKPIMNLLRDPKAERDQYDAIKIHFDTFIKNLDEEREVIDSKTRSDLGTAGGISKMIAKSISAPSYIKSLDNYINNAATEELNRALAIKHRTDTINDTCQQFKHSLLGLRDLHQANQHRAHSEALQGSLNTFMSVYTKELSNDQQKAINVGLSVAKQQVQTNTMSLRR